MRGPVALALTVAAVVSALSAQEPPPPSRPDPVRAGAAGPPAPDPSPGSMSLQILTARRARLGIFFDMRARDTDTIGARIERVTPNSPAARAGLRSGDIITRFNGTSLASTSADLRTGREPSQPGLSLTLLAAKLSPGDTVAIEYRRGAERKNASVIAGDEPLFSAWMTPERSLTLSVPDSPGPSWNDGPPMPPMERQLPPMVFVMGTSLEDLELAPMNPDLGLYFGTGNGVLVINVPRDSKLGLRPGDVVLTADGRAALTPAHLMRILRSYDVGEPIKLEIVRMKKRLAVTGSVSER